MKPVTRITRSFADYYAIMQKLCCIKISGLFGVVKEMALKCGCLIDFYATSLLTMCAYMHAHPCYLLKLEEKKLVDRSLHTESMLIVSHRKHVNCLFKAKEA